MVQWLAYRTIPDKKILKVRGEKLYYAMPLILPATKHLLRELLICASLLFSPLSLRRNAVIINAVIIDLSSSGYAFPNVAGVRGMGVATEKEYLFFVEELFFGILYNQSYCRFLVLGHIGIGVNEFVGGRH